MILEIGNLLSCNTHLRLLVIRALMEFHGARSKNPFINAFVFRLSSGHEAKQSFAMCRDLFHCPYPSEDYVDCQEDGSMAHFPDDCMYSADSQLDSMHPWHFISANSLFLPFSSASPHG